MPVYRVFVCPTPDNKIEGTHTIFCDPDSEAISRADKISFQGGHLVEISQGARVDGCLRSEEAR